jgi:hypothetical protein
MESANNRKIRKILEDLYKYHFKIVKDFNLNKFAKQYIAEMDRYYKSMGINNYKSDQEVKDILGFTLNNAINEAFINVKEINIDENLVIKNFEIQINKSLLLYNEIIKTRNNNVEYQSVFIEDDYFPTGFISLYGQGSFNILDEPKYLDFDFNNQLFNENCKIDYTPVMQKLIRFNQLIEETGLDNYILDSDFYKSLSQMYRFKTYLFLNQAFCNINFNSIVNFKILKPFYVFANEHDSEVSNIYISE